MCFSGHRMHALALAHTRAHLGIGKHDTKKKTRACTHTHTHLYMGRAMFFIWLSTAAASFLLLVTCGGWGGAAAGARHARLVSEGAAPAVREAVPRDRDGGGRLVQGEWELLWLLVA